MTAKRAPAGLSSPAQTIWRRTLAEFDLSEHEYPILEAACRELDLIAEMQKKLDNSSLIVVGSMGQDVANPLLSELRQHRAAYVALVKALKLPDGEAVVHNPRRAGAQAAANARWGRGA